MPKLNYKTLRQEVVDEIRQRILTGDFQAGERIKENEMAQQLGVSRGPVREALRQLEQEGLVQYERNVGCCKRANPYSRLCSRCRTVWSRWNRKTAISISWHSRTIASMPQ